MVGPRPKPSDGSSLDRDKEVPCSRNGDLKVITLIYPKSYSLVVVRQCRVYVIRKASCLSTERCGDPGLELQHAFLRIPTVSGPALSLDC